MNGKGSRYRPGNESTRRCSHAAIFGGSDVGVIKIPMRCADVDTCDNHCWRATPHVPSGDYIRSVKCPFRGEHVRMEVVR